MGFSFYFPKYCTIRQLADGAVLKGAGFILQP
jgi:hypothetical protein